MSNTKLLLAGVVGLVAILAAYVVLVVLGHGAEANQLGPLVLTLLGFLGLGAHTSQRLSSQDEALTTITQQTNGVLTDRIQTGADAAIRRVFQELGYAVPPAPAPAPETIPAPLPAEQETPGQ